MSARIRDLSGITGVSVAGLTIIGVLLLVASAFMLPDVVRRLPSKQDIARLILILSLLAATGLAWFQSFRAWRAQKHLRADSEMEEAVSAVEYLVRAYAAFVIWVVFVFGVLIFLISLLAY